MSSNTQSCVTCTLDERETLYSKATTVTDGKKRFVKVLLIDSITTWHMNSHRKRFHQYEPISRGIIYKGNDLALEIVALAPSK